MKAIQVGKGPARDLSWTDVPDPAYGPGEVLVEVYATALNRADLMQRAGNYPPPPGAPDIMGLDMAGRIAAVGPDVRGWQSGDAACALLGGGGYAEKAAVPAEMLMRVPEGWSFEQAAALPEAYLTAFLNVFLEAGFQAGETVLVHGGASGVGTAAIQLVKHSGGRVVATAGSATKVARCRELGADLAIDYKAGDWAAHVRDYTDGGGVDIVLDMVGAPYLERNIAALKVKGRLVLISTLGGSKGEIDLRGLMGKRARIIGSVLRARPQAEKAEITRRFVERFWPALDSGEIQPVIDRVYPVQEAASAQQRMAENQNIGKIVLKVR